MTHLIINPGSTISNADTSVGWTNTYEGARAEAERWLTKLRNDGIADIELVGDELVGDELVGDDRTGREGRWTFTFRHTVTGVEVVLETHGIDDVEAYRRQHVFYPRVYWNGSSSADPQLSDFAAPGFVQTFRREG